MSSVRQAAIKRLTTWSARRHGRDALPMTVNRRCIYIIPTRFGIALALLLPVAVLLVIVVLVWLGISRHRRAQRKHAGLRVLR